MQISFEQESYKGSNSPSVKHVLHMLLKLFDDKLLVLIVIFIDKIALFKLFTTIFSDLSRKNNQYLLTVLFYKDQLYHNYSFLPLWFLLCLHPHDVTPYFDIGDFKNIESIW